MQHIAVESGVTKGTILQHLCKNWFSICHTAKCKSLL